jgi:hypothetical protein
MPEKFAKGADSFFPTRWDNAFHLSDESMATHCILMIQAIL